MGRQGQAPRHRRRGGSAGGIIPPARRLVALARERALFSVVDGPRRRDRSEWTCGRWATWDRGLEGTTLQYELWSRSRIRVRGAPAVRQSCHIYNDFSQIDETLEVVRRLARL